MLRRFTYILKFTAHSPTRQTAILQQMLEKSDIEAIDATACARRLVEQLECPPAILAKAIETNPPHKRRRGRHLPLLRATGTHHRHTAHPSPVGTACQTTTSVGGIFTPRTRQRRHPEHARRGARYKRARASTSSCTVPSGTGKTEFARTLCGEVGAQLYAIGQNEIGADARLSAGRSKTLDYALEALSDEPNAVILFDEMEDFHQREKYWLNRIVEENPVPIIWACNAIAYYRAFEPFFIDRMLHAVEFHHMPTKAREHIYANILHNARMPDAETRQLAQELAQNNKITPSSGRDGN